MSSPLTIMTSRVSITVKVFFKLQVSRTELILRGEGRNGPNLKLILITLNRFNDKVIKLGVAFQFSIFYIYIHIYIYICMCAIGGWIGRVVSKWILGYS